jgi:hypothetical protein
MRAIFFPEGELRLHPDHRGEHHELIDRQVNVVGGLLPMLRRAEVKAGLRVALVEMLRARVVGELTEADVIAVLLEGIMQPGEGARLLLAGRSVLIGRLLYPLFRQ